MPNQPKAKSKKRPVRYDALEWEDEFLANQKPLNLSQLTRLLDTWFHRQPDGQHEYAEFWAPQYDASSCLCLIGEAGEGKSTIIKHVAKQKMMELRRIPMGETMEEDNMGSIQRRTLWEDLFEAAVNTGAVEDFLTRLSSGDSIELIPMLQKMLTFRGEREYSVGQTLLREFVAKKTHHSFTLPPCMPVDKPMIRNGNGELVAARGGIAFIDECGTGTPTHQNMISALLTDKQYFGWAIEQGWFWVAATNPYSVRYHLNQMLDQRVRDRMFPVLIEIADDEKIHMLSKLNKIPGSLHGFLLMNSQYIGQISARSWEMVGGFVFRWLATRQLSQDEFLNIMRLKIPGPVVEAYRAYLRLGDDPNAYPMLAKELANADEKTHTQHIDRMRRWGRNGKDALVGATSYDLANWIGDDTTEISSTQYRNIADIMQAIPKDDQVQLILDKASMANHGTPLVPHLKNDVFCARIAELEERLADNRGG